MSIIDALIKSIEFHWPKTSKYFRHNDVPVTNLTPSPRRSPDSLYVPRVSPVGQGQTSSIDDIIKRLESLQDPSRYINTSGLENQARSAASQQYDPIIGQLRNQISSTEQRGVRGNQELDDMYSSLSSSLQGDIPGIESFYDTRKTGIDTRYEDLKNSIGKQYNDSQNEQIELLKRLGIEAAASDTLPDQIKDRDYFQSLALTEGQTQNTALGQEERGALDYTRRSSQIARSEGANKRSDLMFQLDQAISDLQNQLSSQEIAKQQAYSSNYGSLQEKMTENARQQSQRDFDNYIKTIGVGRQLQQDQLGSQTGSSVRSPADVAMRALQSGLNQSDAQDIQDIFSTSIGSDPIILAGIDPNYGTALPREALAARVVEAGRASGLSQQELNILQTIALEYFGRR